MENRLLMIDLQCINIQLRAEVMGLGEFSEEKSRQQYRGLRGQEPSHVQILTESKGGINQQINKLSERMEERQENETVSRKIRKKRGVRKWSIALNVVTKVL